MLQFRRILIIFTITSVGSCGRLDAQKYEDLKVTTEAIEKSHMEMIMEKIVPSVSEDHIKVMKMENGTIYDANKAKGKPELFRKMGEKLHAVTQTDFNENETTTELHPESTSHSHVYERTAHTKTTVHKTKKEKPTTEMPTNLRLARAKRSFTKEEMESFSEMGKVFSESFKKFNDDAAKAQKDFMGFMKKLDDISASHDSH